MSEGLEVTSRHTQRYVLFPNLFNLAISIEVLEKVLRSIQVCQEIDLQRNKTLLMQTILWGLTRLDKY